jgi:hypothetical protein
MRAAIGRPRKKRQNNQQKVSATWRRAFLHAICGDAGDMTWAASAAGIVSDYC